MATSKARRKRSRGSGNQQYAQTGGLLRSQIDRSLQGREEIASAYTSKRPDDDKISFELEDGDYNSDVLDMKGCTLISKSKIKLNEKKCDQLLKLQKFESERPVRPTHVVSLYQHMKLNTFRPELVPIAVANCPAISDELIRLNGQHTCWAVKTMCERVDPDFFLEVTQLHYYCETERDLRALYSSFDRGHPRSPRDITASYLFGTAEFGGYSKSLLNHLSSAYGLWRWDTKTERNKNDRGVVSALLLGSDYALAQRVCGILDQIPYSVDTRHIWRSATIAAMFETSKKAKTDSETFWLSVAFGTGFESATDPRLKLRNLLLQTSVNYGKGAMTKGDKKLTVEEMYRACVQMWNYWRESRPVQIVRFPTKKRPKAA